MRQVSSDKKFSKTSYLLLFILSSLLTLILLAGDSFFKVKKVEVMSEKLKDLRSFNNIFIGKNILFLNDKKVKENILESNAQVRSVSIEKLLPHTVRIRVELDSPIAALIVDQGFFELSDNGKIIKKSRIYNNDIPKINYYQKLNYSSFIPGDYVGYNEIKTALVFLKKLDELKLGIANVDINGLNMIRLNLKSAVILTTTEKDVRIQIYQLEKIIRQFRIEGKEFETLDLRFNKPVIKIK